ncbi:MAG: carboxymuconolactone decarboxylase family protein, partial [Ramlibacter sp.]|nr:carboxymuconolactone decarboxylase family protein [Ramlibacter sp.]
MSIAPSARAARAFPEAGLPERLGPPAVLDVAQQAAADELIKGPRRGVYGPFRPLLHRPALLSAVAKVGETLRYQGGIDAGLREWTICVVARELSNVFEWDMHLPLAEAAGVPADALAALGDGQPSPDRLR